MRHTSAPHEARLARGHKLRLALSTLAFGTLLAACGGGDPVDSGRVAPLASGATGCAKRVNNTLPRLVECMTLAGVRRHQAELQAIADANGHTRVSGSPGYDLSADYAAKVFRDAGYVVTRQEFQFRTFTSLSPAVLEQVAPLPGGPIENNVMSYSGSGDVTAPAVAPGGDARGCYAADFAGFPAGSIALVSRGTPAGFPGGACTFAIKATNASQAGAVGVVIYNNAAGALNGTLGEAFNLDLAVTGITQATGQQLVATAGLVLHLKTETLRTTTTSSNVIAESVGGNPDKVVMVGAHLDSVAAGPGINDNGSGSAAVLETAVQMAKVNPINKVRFALWGAEEANLVGSTYYVANLTQAERDRIALYLNFDMIGSPNHVFFVYDGDDSDGEGAGPGPVGPDGGVGSAEIEEVFEDFFKQRGIPFKGTDFSGRSDYGPFIAAQIPAGGLFTGAEGIKTAEEAALWGGTAGVAYDPCYHQACDTYANNNDVALETNAKAVAYSTLYFARTTASVNQKRGKGSFVLPDIYGDR